jgi:hypothetical protein
VTRRVLTYLVFRPFPTRTQPPTPHRKWVPRFPAPFCQLYFIATSGVCLFPQARSFPFKTTAFCVYPVGCRLRARAAANGLLAFPKTTALGSPPRPPLLKRSVGTRGAASMQDTLPEGTPHAQGATQLAPSAVTAGAVGGSANRSVVGRVSPTMSGSSNAAQSPAPCGREG